MGILRKAKTWLFGVDATQYDISEVGTWSNLLESKCVGEFILYDEIGRENFIYHSFVDNVGRIPYTGSKADVFYLPIPLESELDEQPKRLFSENDRLLDQERLIKSACVYFNNILSDFSDVSNVQLNSNEIYSFTKENGKMIKFWDFSEPVWGGEPLKKSGHVFVRKSTKKDGDFLYRAELEKMISEYQKSNTGGRMVTIFNKYSREVRRHKLDVVEVARSEKARGDLIKDCNRETDRDDQRSLAKAVRKLQRMDYDGIYLIFKTNNVSTGKPGVSDYDEIFFKR
jgi:hypothetical protein